MIQIEYNDGGSYGTYINSYTDFNIVKQNKRKEIIHKLIEQLDDDSVIQDITERILSFCGECKDLGYDEDDREQYYRYTMNVDVEFNEKEDIDKDYED